jgi:hypothetical protein
MVGQDRAEVVETMMVVVENGWKAATDSIQELIYPTEYEPPGLPLGGPLEPDPKDLRQLGISRSLRIPSASTAFEIRSVGSNFEALAMIAPQGGEIDLQFLPQMVTLGGYEAYEDFATIGGRRHQNKWPVFVTERVTAQLSCRDGQYILAAVLTPKDDEGQIDPGRKMLVLVKCDVLVVKE